MFKEYFNLQLDLLQAEREADLQSYVQLAAQSSVSERRLAGMTWYPIAIRGSETGRGDYLTVEVERTTHQNLSHQLRSGAAAVLFSNHDPETRRLEGTITYLRNNRLKISLRTDELPDWCREGKLGVELLFDNYTYEEMEGALKQAAGRVELKAEGRLIRILAGGEAPVFSVAEPALAKPLQTALNPSQLEAVDKILAAEDLAIVHGPPGTGKTTTLVAAIATLRQSHDKPILVVAPSNAAVDLLSEKLASAGLNVLRIGDPARVSEELNGLTLESKIAVHPEMKEVRKLKKQAAEFKDMAHKYKRNFGKAERDQRKALFDEAHRLMKDAGRTEDFIIDDVVSKAQVITATLVGCNHYSIRNLKYGTVVIDEAGQALEPASWIPILKADKVVLAGDHCQLPPTIKSMQAAKRGLATTLFEKCIAAYPDAVVLLEEQYRMNTSIMGFSSQEFYGDRLKAHPSVADRRLFPADVPLSFVDTAGCGFEEQVVGTSTANPDEAAFLVKHLTVLLEQGASFLAQHPLPSFAIISPYREQIPLIRDLLEAQADIYPYMPQISVNTIDSFQGQECDVVYISMTRSNPERTIGFLTDIRRMNVAMTRARKKLVVIGDSSTLSRLPFYADFISYAERLGGYQSAWEYMD